ncbi:uncharacterized protein IUM83_05140 [Phytophthora cinnamomi]|uniref:uncharacterized protein n=1 Tax=Phytophthora cinnamomi TaxID=4785 RepID=UPI00355A76E2|nr:hypothetical protein IUM83_05140 [Phytophthora cinnamomi]
MEVSSTPGRRELTDIEREQVIVSLLQRSVNGVPRRGAVKEVAEKFQVNPRTISRLWRLAKEENAKSDRLCAESRRHDRDRPMADLSAKLERLRIIPLEQRSTLRSSPLSCGVSRATLQCRVKDEQLVAHTSNVNPLLTEANKTKNYSTWQPSGVDTIFFVTKQSPTAKFQSSTTSQRSGIMRGVSSGEMKFGMEDVKLVDEIGTDLYSAAALDVFKAQCSTDDGSRRAAAAGA